MKIKKEWTVTCRGCDKPFQLYEYEGLEGARYGSHYCKEISDLLVLRPRIRKLFKEPQSHIA